MRNYLTLRQEEARQTADSGGQKTEGTPTAEIVSKFKPAVFDVLRAYQGTAALKCFDLFAKAYQLRHVWKLDPTLMQQVSQTYGPVDFRDPNTHHAMDWRHADCHSMYWALKGLDIAKQEKDREIDAQEVNTDRMVLHSLQDLFRNGKIMIFQGWETPEPQTADAGAEAAAGPAQGHLSRPRSPLLRFLREGLSGGVWEVLGGTRSR